MISTFSSIMEDSQTVPSLPGGDGKEGRDHQEGREDEGEDEGQM